MPNPAPSTAYSGTPLAKKLGLVAGSVVHTIGAPDGYLDWLAPLPPDLSFADKVTKQTDLIHLFTLSAGELATLLTNLRHTIRADAAVWVSWPKKASKVATDITEDTIRAICLPMGFVDIKVCAVSEVWSGLKLVVRKELRD